MTRLSFLLGLGLGFLSLAPSFAEAAAIQTLAGRSTVSCTFSTSADDGETCTGLASQWGLTLVQFEALNPNVTCPDLVYGDSYCVLGSVSSSTLTPQRTIATVSYTLPTDTGVTSTFINFTHVTTTSSTSSTVSSTSVKTSTATTTKTSSYPTQSGLASDCNNLHKVVKGDTCTSIESAYGITSDQFLTWNPSISTDCINLFVGYGVCVGVPGASSSISTSTSSVTSVTTSSTSAITSVTTSVATTATASTTTTSSSTSTVPSPLMPSTLSNCTSYHLIASGDTCAAIESDADITSDEFLAWNPAVDASCDNIYLGYYVCVGMADSLSVTKIESTSASTTASTTVSTSSTTSTSTVPSPLMPSTLRNCTSYHLVASGDTCSDIESDAGITSDEFLAWNPAVDSTCDNIYLGYYVCVGVSGETSTATSTSTSTTSSATATSTAPSPLMPGTISTCDDYYLVVSGDTCSAIESAAGITSDEFLEWNTEIDSSCDNIYLGYYVCIGVTGETSTATSTPTSTTSSATPSSTAPSPLMPGTISTCTTYHLVVSGDTCAAIESDAGITSDAFLEWNTDVDSSCDNIYLGYYVCIGA